MAEHSPTPWVVSDHMEDTPATHLRIWSPQDKSIEAWPEVAVCYADDDLPIQEMEANAEHIVRCVNAHDELVAALKWISDVPDINEYHPRGNAIAEMRQRAKDALRSARGSTS